MEWFFFVLVTRQIVFKAGHHLHTRLNIIVQWALEHGHFEYFKQKTNTIINLQLPPTNVDVNLNNLNLSSVEFDDLKLTFYMFGVGVLISLIVFCIEIISK